MRLLQHHALELLKNQPNVDQIKLSHLAALVMNDCCVKLPANAVNNIGRWVLDHGIVEYVNKFIEWYHGHINPLEVAVSPIWFEETCKKIGKKRPLLKYNTLIINYDAAGRIAKVRPTPDDAKFIANKDLIAIEKRPELMDMAEAAMVTNRRQFEAELTKRCNAQQAEEHINLFEQPLSRLLFQKPLDAYPWARIVGKFDQEKIFTLKMNWLHQLELNIVMEGLAASQGVILDKESDEDGDDHEEVSCDGWGPRFSIQSYGCLNSSSPPI